MQYFLTATVLAAAITAVIADTLADGAAFNFCTDNKCTDCPASVTSSGTGYPACVVYNSADVFAAGDFAGSDGGGYEVYMDISQPDAGCATIIKSPAGTDIVGCGTTIGAYHQATCSVQELKTTFMVQFCCGTGDCDSAGAKKGRGLEGRAPSTVGVMIKDKNGTVIAPIEVGKPIDVARLMSARRTEEQNVAAKKNIEAKRSPKPNPLPAGLAKRVSCDSWTVDGDPGGYTKPADAVQIVSNSVNGGTGGASIMVSITRESSFTSTVEAGVNLEVFSASTSFSYEMSVSSSKAVSVPIPAGSVGKLGFTPTLKCTMGTLVCDDGTTTGEACTGFTEADDVAGTYAVIATS